MGTGLVCIKRYAAVVDFIEQKLSLLLRIYRDIELTASSFGGACQTCILKNMWQEFILRVDSQFGNDDEQSGFSLALRELPP